MERRGTSKNLQALSALERRGMSKNLQALSALERLGTSKNLHALSALLSHREGDDDDDDDDDDDHQSVAPSAHLGPGHIGPPTTTRKEEAVTTVCKKKTTDIWSEEEVAECPRYEDLADPRPQPDYEIILKQSVGTQDVFLGMSGKDPSSMCCEAMLVRVKLPDTSATDVALDVRETFLDLRTPKYKLGLHLPHAVHSQEGKAQFYSEKEELEVTLFINRTQIFK